MSTACTPDQFEFHALGSREVVGRFDGGRISSDGGGLLLREVDQRIGLLHRLANCFRDYRNPNSIEHSVRALVSQRVYGLALGYEDLNDHSFAYVLMHGLRRLGPQGTRHARAQCTTIRLKLLKIGARIRITVRKVWLSFSEACPYVSDIAQILANLHRVPAWAPPGYPPP